MAKRRYTPKSAIFLREAPLFLKSKTMSQATKLRAMKRVAKARKRAGKAVRRNGINLKADRLWRARRLVPIKRYVKGASARRFDLGVKVGGRMRRVFD